MPGMMTYSMVVMALVDPLGMLKVTLSSTLLTETEAGTLGLTS